MRLKVFDKIIYRNHRGIVRSVNHDNTIDIFLYESLDGYYNWRVMISELKLRKLKLKLP